MLDVIREKKKKKREKRPYVKEKGIRSTMTR